jgi:hypothetical protein
MGGSYSTDGRDEKCLENFGWKRNRPLGRPHHRWDDIRLDLRESRRQVVGWIHLAHDTDQWRAPVITVMKLWVP